MQRRKFIKLSASSLALLLADKLVAGCDTPWHRIGLPDEVWILCGGEWTLLKLSGDSTYTYLDMQVSLATLPDTVSVELQAPHSAVKKIRLKWKYTPAKGAISLGDHWERSYGDLAWRSPEQGRKEPWYLLLHDSRDTVGFGVKTGCNAFCWWTIGPRDLELTMDTRSAGIGVELGGRKLHVADILTIRSKEEETPFMTARRFCSLMCTAPRLPEMPVYGINDWYFAYGNNSPQLILEQTKLMTDLAEDNGNRPFSVIDAGWAEYSPLLPGDSGWQDDFSKPNQKFGDMQKLAADIKKERMRPGLWTRPLCARHDDKPSLLLPSIPGRDNPKNPILDPTIEENLERVKRNIGIYKEWGFELVKHDFSTYDITGKWGFEMEETITVPGWSFMDKTKTTAEVIKILYQSIRDAAGDIYLLGCNTVSHLSAGLFEINRIGDDTSGKEWSRTLKMGVNTLGFRIVQDGHFYATDGDCVGLTKDVAWEKNKQWMQLLAESGTPLFISAQPDVLGAEQKSAIRTAFRQAASRQPIGEPLDWLSNPRPSKWKLNNRIVSFDWNGV